MALYCNTCGAGNPDDSDYCSRCGAHIAPAQAGDLVLPDWLKQAAAESPAPVQARAGAASPEPPDSPNATSRPSIPSGDLASSMPSWLTNPLHVEAHVEPEESLLKDPTDTKGFITEDDLPAWIRQIAIEEEARQAERVAKPADPEPLEAAPPAADSAPTRRRLLPGEIDTARPAANPWLARGDRGPVETPSVPAPEPAPARATVEPAAPPAESSRKVRLPSRDEITLRHMLIGAAVLVALVLLLVFLV